MLAVQWQEKYMFLKLNSEFGLKDWITEWLMSIFARMKFWESMLRRFSGAWNAPVRRWSLRASLNDRKWSDQWKCYSRSHWSSYASPQSWCVLWPTEMCGVWVLIVKSHRAVIPRPTHTMYSVVTLMWLWSRKMWKGKSVNNRSLPV